MVTGSVTYDVEFTRNLGNFENVKPAFGLNVDFDVDSLDDVEAIKDEIKEKVDSWLTETVAELEAELKELGLGNK